MRFKVVGSVVVVMIILVGFPTHAQFQDDPPVDECLGPNDPFCSPDDGGGGSGGGGNTGSCWGCKFSSSGGSALVECVTVSGSGWFSCQSEIRSDGTSQCHLWNPGCVSG